MRAYDSRPWVILTLHRAFGKPLCERAAGTLLASEQDRAESEAEKRSLDFSEREVVLRADFDQLDEESCVWTSMRFMLKGPRHPRQGEWVFLLDSRGRGCMGRIEELNGWTAKVRPDWDSWVPAGELPPGATSGGPPSLAG